MKSKVNIIIVEDNRLLREGLKSLLASHTDYELIAEAQDGLEALRLVREKQPDFVLIDLSLPKLSGISVIKEIKNTHPDIKILALTIHESGEIVFHVFDAGADGYCIKDSCRRDVQVAIRTVLEGKTYISPQVKEKIMVDHPENVRRLKSKADPDTITRCEMEVLRLAAEGYTK